MRTLLFALALVLVQPFAALPNKPGSLKFLVAGNTGTGDRPQYEVADQMTRLRERFKFDLVVLVGGNIFGGKRPRDFQQKFETPYKRLLSSGVTFRASLGDDDAPEQRYYALFNMDGRRYYTFSPATGVRFFALDAHVPMPEQTRWLEQELQSSTEPWKIAFLHDALYGSAADPRVRDTLEPIFVKHNVSVVLSGRARAYERITPQKGTAHFVVGSGGQLRRGGVTAASAVTARRFDEDRAFLAAEIAGDDMHFAVISRTGQTVDAGIIRRRH